MNTEKIDTEERNEQETRTQEQAAQERENKEHAAEENRMGVMPVNKLLISISLPMMVSMLVQALYNIVDSIFVSRINENALTAVSLAFPIQTLMIALGTGTGVGVNALLSRSLGEKNTEKANKIADNGVFLALISYLVFLVVGLTAVTPFYKSQTTDAEILAYGQEYLTVVCCLSFGMYAQFIFERLMQSTGKTVYTMITQGTGAIINIIMDPILIFGLFGFPKMGVTGAAVATVLGQIVAAVFAFLINQKKNTEITLSPIGYRPDRKIIGQIYAIGVPTIIMQSIGSVMTYGMNRILIAFSSTATAVFGVYYKLQSFIFMPVFGLNNGMVPIIAYNYGARKKDRMLKTMRLSTMYGIGIMLIGLAIFRLLPEQLLLLFDASEDMLAIGVPALRTISISFLFAGYCIVNGSVFQALGNAVYSMIVSVARQLFVLLPCAYALSRIGGLDAVWWAFPIAEVVSLFVTTFFLIRTHKTIISKMA